MKRLDRTRYNDLIDQLNRKEEKPEETVEELTKHYKELLCHFPDYEELVMLLNLCIAKERANDYEKLYEYYRQVDDILTNHSGVELHAAYELYYCTGIFSFKFHEYDKAFTYFKKCLEYLAIKYELPYNPDILSYYVPAKILVSYALEYSKEPECVLKAIVNVLEHGLVDVERISAISVDNIVDEFFKYNESDLYKQADKNMKNEIIHMLAHCFSEYAAYLKKQPNKNINDIYTWECLSEKFIESLGPDMVTCKATILAEHGHYYDALDILWARYNLFSKDDNSSEKAEVSFYLYYFSNRMGINDNGVKQCKNNFLSYAKKSKNVDTKLYAWITDFRERFSDVVHRLTPDSISELEELFQADIASDIRAHGYAHPQIREEEMRLQLAYQIVRSYALINNRRTGDPEPVFDNSLFEKCVIFNELSREHCGEAIEFDGSSDPQERFISIDKSIRFCGLSLSVRGFSESLRCKLSDTFNTNIAWLEDNHMGNQKIIVCLNSNEIPELVNDKIQSFTYFVYCEDQNIEKFEEAVDWNNNYHYFSRLEEVFKVAYIQETIERCHICAHKWNEYFIMAPITDNSTFAFQNQAIKKYIKLSDNANADKAIFSNSNGYVTNDFAEERCIKEIQYEIPGSETFSNERVFFYYDRCLYAYNWRKKVFVPKTICEDVSSVVEQLRPLLPKAIRSDLMKQNCNCLLKLDSNQCVCSDCQIISRKKTQVNNLLMSLSLDKIKEESVFTLYIPELHRDGSVDSFVFILSSKFIRNYQNRSCFDFENLVYQCKHPSDPIVLSRDSDNTESLATLSERKEVSLRIEDDMKRLSAEIQQYTVRASDNLSSEDKATIDSMQKRIKEEQHTLKLFVEIQDEWNSFKKG